MHNFTDKLFNKLAEQSGALANIADQLLNRILPQETAEATSCTVWYWSAYCCFRRWRWWRMIYRYCYRGNRQIYQRRCVTWRYC